VVSAVGFSTSSIVYEIDRLALWLKVSINAVVGFGIFFFVGSNIGIISFESLINIAISVVIAVIIFIIVCFGDYLFNGREAKKINAKLRERESNGDM